MKHTKAIWKRIGAAALAGCMALAFTACDAGTASSGTAGISGDKEALLEKYKDLPEKKYIEKYGEIPYSSLNGATINITTWWGEKPGDRTASEYNAKMWDRIDYLEKTYDCKFAFNKMELSEIVTNLTTSVASGDPFADFVSILGGSLLGLVKQGMLQDMESTQYLDPTETKWSPSSLEFGDIRNKHYVIEYGKTMPTHVVFFNKNIFEKQQLGNPYRLVDEGKWTWDTFKDIAIKATVDTDGDGKPNQYGVTGVLQNLVYTNGGVPVAFDHETGMGKYTLNTQECFDGMNFATELRYGKQVVDDPAANGAPWSYYTKQFKSGKVAMAIMECYLYQRDLKDMKDDFGIVPLPKGPNAEKNVSVASSFPTMVMPANNPMAKEKAFIYDLFTELLPGETDSYSKAWEVGVRDEETVKYIAMCSDNRVFAYQEWYSGAAPIVGECINAAYRNNKTLAQSSKEAEQQVSAVIEEVNSKPFK